MVDRPQTNDLASGGCSKDDLTRVSLVVYNEKVSWRTLAVCRRWTPGKQGILWLGYAVS